MKVVVCRFGIHKSRGHTHLRIEHLNWCLRPTYWYRETTPPKPVFWEKLVTLMQHMWERSTLPTKLICTIHKILNIFQANRGMGMTIMELKMSQDISRINQDPLLLVLLELRKS